MNEMNEVKVWELSTEFGRVKAVIYENHGGKWSLDILETSDGLSWHSIDNDDECGVSRTQVEAQAEGWREVYQMKND